jgi:aminoglycoside phosphotransferase (APT) family kinase protein
MRRWPGTPTSWPACEPVADASALPGPLAHQPNVDHLAARLAAAVERWHPDACVTSVRWLPGGESSLTYVASIRSAPCSKIVVKVAPPGLAATRNRNILRQARLLAELHRGGSVPVPEVLFIDDGAAGADVAGAHGGAVGPLFAMSFCPGQSVEPNVDPAAELPVPSMLEDRARHAARVLAAIHGSVIDAEWFAAEQPVTLTAEIDRWERALATLPGEFGLDWEPLCRRLRATQPPPVPPCLTHGDYRLGNLLCDGGQVSAVIDWEIWSRSDPRLDLAWFLLTLDAAHPAAVRQAPGLPGPHGLLEEYESALGVPAGPLSWFTAASLFKLTATTGLIAKHALRRGDTANWGLGMVPLLRQMLADPPRALAEL